MKATNRIKRKKKNRAVDRLVLKKLIFRRLPISEYRRILDDVIHKRRPDRMKAFIFTFIWPGRLPVEILCESLGADIDFFRSMTLSEYEAVLRRAEKKNPRPTKTVKKLFRLSRKRLHDLEKKGAITIYG